MKFLLLLVFGIIYLIPNISNGQFNCPPQDTCMNPWIQNILDHSLTASSTIRIKAFISHRINCDGVMEFVIDSTYAYNNGQYLEDFQYEEYEVNTARDLIWLHILEFPSDFGYASVPNCSADTLQIAHFYTASCGVWVKCSYKIEDGSRQCDTGYEPPYPEYFDGPVKFRRN